MRRRKKPQTADVMPTKTGILSGNEEEEKEYRHGKKE
jgi:hypothetical protein